MLTLPKACRESRLDAEGAALSGDLHTRLIYADGSGDAIQLWDELRTWDPGD